MATVEVAGVGFDFPEQATVEVSRVRFSYGGTGTAARVQVGGVKFSYGPPPPGPPGSVQVGGVRFYFGPAGGLTPGESLLCQWDGDRWVRLPVVTWNGTAWVGAS